MICLMIHALRKMSLRGKSSNKMCANLCRTHLLKASAHGIVSTQFVCLRSNNVEPKLLIKGNYSERFVSRGSFKSFKSVLY